MHDTSKEFKPTAGSGTQVLWSCWRAPCIQYSRRAPDAVTKPSYQIEFPSFCWPSLCPASARFAVVTMPKPLKKNSSQPMAKCARSKGKRTDACLQVKGKAGKSTDRQAARIRAAAQALLANVGRGGISRLVEDTGVELNEKGIRTRVTNRHQQPSAQHDSMQAMEVAQHQQHSAASPLPAFSPQHPNTPVTAIKQKQDINSLLSGWSLKTPPKDCQEAPPAAAGQ